MAQYTAPRLTFCYGGHDWNVTVWVGHILKRWAGDTHLPWLLIILSQRSLSLCIKPPVAVLVFLFITQTFFIVPIWTLDSVKEIPSFLPNGKQTKTSASHWVKRYRCNHAFSLSRSGALWSCNRPEDMELAQRVSETCQTAFPYNRKRKWSGDWPVLHLSNSGPHLNRSPGQSLWRLLVSLSPRTATEM